MRLYGVNFTNIRLSGLKILLQRFRDKLKVSFIDSTLFIERALTLFAWRWA